LWQHEWTREETFVGIISTKDRSTKHVVSMF
jgi:hypothetical protein